ncbi:MFS transporter [Demequina phytophila]|uniref:MFS transporter n=1 Tax=Demequina phytophila TaxID=1638981 RepID=UPI00147061F2|nr:MFS transporter [Demequina phytophila]
MSRWLWVAYPLALLGVTGVWGAVLQVLLSTQIATIVSEIGSAAGTLGWVVSIGAVSSVLAQPILGRLSDRTRTKILGPRNVWVLGGAAAGAVALVATGLMTTPISIAIAWAVAMWPLSGVQAALTAVMPERIPLNRRGSMSGIVGTIQIVGGFIGVTLAGVADTTQLGYVFAGVLLITTSFVFALTTKDPLRGRPRLVAGEAPRVPLPTFTTAPDFWWTFTSRFLVLFGFFLTTTMQLYIIRDWIGAGAGTIEAAQDALIPIVGVNSLATMLCAVLAGVLADRFGRLKPFVATSALLGVPAGLVVVFNPTMTGLFITSVLSGVALGAYMAVDQALISRVIPSKETAARDLGLINIANAGPQIIAPVIAGAVVAATGNYALLYIALGIFAIPGALAVLKVRSVR